MQPPIFFWLLIPVMEVLSCGGNHLYLFWDSNCGGDHHAAWILSPKKPDPLQSSNLHQATEEGCHNLANYASSASSLPSSSRWESYDTCCTSEVGKSFVVSVTSLGSEGWIKPSGLCDVVGGMRGVNQIYHMSGRTTSGLPWYTSAEIIETYEAADHDGFEHVLAIIVGTVLITIVGICITLCSLCLCYHQKICCFQDLQQPTALHQPGRQPAGVVVGQPVAQAQQPVKPIVVQATVISVAKRTSEDNPNLGRN